MNERFNTHQGRDRVASFEAPRIRLEVLEGPKGSFDDAIRVASESGVETVDVTYGRQKIEISNISAMNKRSKDYSVCTGLVAIGRGGGQSLSLLTHQFPSNNPDFLLSSAEALKARLLEFVMKVDPHSIDCGFFGGEYASDITPSDPLAEQRVARNIWYDDVRERVSALVRETLSQEMKTVAHANAPGELSSIFLDTPNAKLYIERYRAE